MKKFILFLISLVLLSPIFFSINVEAGSKAGVGVLNVPPEFNNINVDQVENTVRVYLTLSDYNSWEDIFDVNIILEYYGSEVARFTFNQYSVTTSYQKTNIFTETSKEGDLLQKDKSTFSHSDQKETVEDRCNFELLFVFRTTWFSHFKIVTTDREGATATTQVDYSAEDMMRSSNMIMIPGIDGPIPVEISGMILNIIALVGGAVGVFYISQKMNLIRGFSFGKAK
jgi:hypothetical protein